MAVLRDKRWPRKPLRDAHEDVWGSVHCRGRFAAHGFHSDPAVCNLPHGALWGQNEAPGLGLGPATGFPCSLGHVAPPWASGPFSVA